jgi:hypothetical protein
VFFWQISSVTKLHKYAHERWFVVTKQLLGLSEAQAEPVELLPEVLLKQAQNAAQAVHFMITHSGITHEAIASDIGKQRETVTRFANGNGGLRPDDIEALINACGNAFFLQYVANKFGFDLVRQDKLAKRKAELRAELEMLEKAA